MTSPSNVMATYNGDSTYTVTYQLDDVSITAPARFFLVYNVVVDFISTDETIIASGTISKWTSVVVRPGIAVAQTSELYAPSDENLIRRRRLKGQKHRERSGEEEYFHAHFWCTCRATPV